MTLWVKSSGVAGAQYADLKDVDLQQSVSDFKRRWMAQAKLDVDPSLVTLRLVKCGAGKPTPKQEAKAKVLDDPSLTLAEAKVTGTSWLSAFVAGASTIGLSLGVDSFSGARLFSARKACTIATD